MRKDVDRLIALLAPLGAELTLTTNASLLAPKAEALAAAGLDRVTVSLDSLDDETFQAMNDVDFPVARVLEGIDAAAAEGLPGQGERRRQARPERARDPRHGAPLPRQRPHPPLHRVHGRRRDERLAARRRRPGRRDRRADLARSSRSSRSTRATAARSRSAGATATARGEIGLIASVTQPFCGDCTRARISAEGRLYTCLFGIRGHDLRALLRGGASDEELRDAVTGDLGQAHRPLLGAAHGGDVGAAEGRDELHRWLRAGARARAALPLHRRRARSSRADAIEVEVPRGEPRQLLAGVADALAAREPAEVLREKLAAAADALEAPGDDDVRARARLPARAAVPRPRRVDQGRARRRRAAARRDGRGRARRARARARARGSARRSRSTSSC